MRIRELIITVCSFVLLPLFAEAQETVLPADVGPRPVDLYQSYRNISGLTNEYIAYNELSPRKQRMIVQSSGYRNLFSMKFKKNRGYYVNQPFTAPDRAKFAVMAKHAYYVSLVLGFNNTMTDYYMFEPVATIDNVDNRNFDFEIAGGYFVENNVAMGVRFGYALNDKRMKIESPIFDLTANTKDMYLNNAGTTFTGGFFVKNFIPVDPDQQLFIVNETNLRYTYKYGLRRDRFQEGERVSKEELRSHIIGIGVTPGIMYFLTSGLSLEFLISPLFVFYEDTRLLNNESEHGNMRGGGLNFMLTPLKINFGITYFFGLNERKGYKRGVY